MSPWVRSPAGAEKLLAWLRKRASVPLVTTTTSVSSALFPGALEAHLRPELFRALGDPTRLALVARLAGATEPITVTEASTCCGVHLSGVSRHLSHLAQVGIVRAEREGREVRYELNHDELAAALRGLADALESCCGATTDRASERDGGTT